jgi:branched-chain amino acid transport system permease protein
VGLTLVYGLLRILHIAHAAVFALGAYVTVLATNATGSIAFGFIAAVAITPLFGMATYRLLYEPLLKYHGDVPMIASLGLLVLMQDAFRLVFGEQGVTFHNSALSFTTYRVVDLTVSAPQLATVLAALATSWVCISSRPGRGSAWVGGLRCRGRRSRSASG